MNIGTYEKMMEELEKIIDTRGIHVNGVLQMMSEIAYEKADHVRSTWADEPLAKLWERIGKKLDGYSNTIKIIEKHIW